jgi:hypothetical protein
MLTVHHVREQAVLDVPTVNTREPLLLSGGALKPDVKVGCTLEETLTFHRQAILPSEQTGSSCRRLLELYADETYVLAWSAESRKACVSLKENADSRSVLRALWQASWLEFHCLDSDPVAGLSSVERSYAAVCKAYQGFETELQRLGWQPTSVAYLVPEKFSRIMQ